MQLVRKLSDNEILDYFEPVQGSINFYYGHVGNGKTYAATADILEILKKGDVVFANWKIEVPDFDQRVSFFHLIYHNLFFRKRFFRYPKENFHYFDPDSYERTQDLIEKMSQWANCHVFVDEGQWLFDSYEGTKFSKAKRRLILHTRHYHRTLNIISQRPTAIQVSARGNVNRFYKCVKLVSWPWIRFARYEFQQMTGETVDENADPISKKTYWGSNSVFRAYNTDYLAEGIPKSQDVYFEAFDLNFKERFIVLIRWFKNRYLKFLMVLNNFRDSRRGKFTD